MGILTRAFSPRAVAPVLGGNTYVPGLGYSPSSPATFETTARAYTGNEILTAGLNLLSNSAAEPHIIGRRYRRNRREIRAEAKYLKAIGVQNRPDSMQIDAMLARNGFWEELDAHPLVTLVNNPNPYMSRGQFWSAITLDKYLAGKAFALKARYSSGLLEGAVGELWRLRPDRMKPVPGDMPRGEPFIKEWEYTIDARTKQIIPARDVMYFKANNPLDPYDGLSPLLSLMPRIAIDTAQRRFLQTFYERGGAGVGAALNIKGSMDDQQKADLRARFRRMFSGGQYDILVTSAEDVQYTPFNLARGLVDAIPKEVNDITESRVAMVLGIPPAVFNLLIGSETSSYANQRTAFSVYWFLTMTPLLSGYDDVLNLSLIKEEQWGGIDELVFDLSDIPALREDEDALQERARKNWAAGVAYFEETRIKLGLPPDVPSDALFAVPSTTTITPFERLGEEPEPPPAPVNPPQLPSGEPEGGEEAQNATQLLTGPRAGRPRLEDDPSARAIHDEAVALRAKSPHLSWEQVAARVGVSDRTLREYRRRFLD